MWGLLGSYGTFVKAGILVVLVCSIFFAGWHMRDRDFTIYKDQVRVESEKAQAHTETIKAEHALVTKGIKDEYDAKLNLLRQYYANGVRNNNGGNSVPGISTTTAVTNAASTYSILAGQCAETTLMLTELQKWITEQMGIK
jgi:hypothetical protein